MSEASWAALADQMAVPVELLALRVSDSLKIQAGAGQPSPNCLWLDQLPTYALLCPHAPICSSELLMYRVALQMIWICFQHDHLCRPDWQCCGLGFSGPDCALEIVSFCSLRCHQLVEESGHIFRGRSMASHPAPQMQSCSAPCVIDTLQTDVSAICSLK